MRKRRDLYSRAAPRVREPCDQAELAACKDTSNLQLFVSWDLGARIDQPGHSRGVKRTPPTRCRSASCSRRSHAAAPFGVQPQCLINAAGAPLAADAPPTNRQDGPHARLRPPFDNKSGRELDRQRARDGLVLWCCRLGVVEGSKALQRADRSYTSHTARSVRGGRFVLLVVYGDS